MWVGILYNIHKINHEEMLKNKQEESFYYDYTTQQLSQVCVLEVKVLLWEKQRGGKNDSAHEISYVIDVTWRKEHQVNKIRFAKNWKFGKSTKKQ